MNLSSVLSLSNAPEPGLKNPIYSFDVSVMLAT
jgi:hypothetical protein